MTALLHTARLELRPATAALLRAELDGPAALGAALGVAVPVSWPPELYDADAVRWTLGHLRDPAHGDPFGFYYALLGPGQLAQTAEGALAGCGGFKGPPDAQGEVELGYAVAAEFRRLGLATEMVRGWSGFAFGHPDVRMVVGQTLDGMTASIGVLERAGFHFAGAGADPHATAGERVLRYELRVKSPC